MADAFGRDEYTPRQRDLAQRFYMRLHRSCLSAAPVLGSHGLATALLAAGVETAKVHMSPGQVAAWLRGIAEAMEVDACEQADSPTVEPVEGRPN